MNPSSAPTQSGIALLLAALISVGGCESATSTTQPPSPNALVLERPLVVDGTQMADDFAERQLRLAPDPMPEPIEMEDLLGRAIEQLLKQQGIDMNVTEDSVIPEGGGSMSLEGRDLTCIIIEPLRVVDRRLIRGIVQLIDDTDPGESVWALVTFRPDAEADSACCLP